MKIVNQHWPIKKLIRLHEKIDPRPQYQRGDVWKLPAQQLLIDSILFSFDIPKIYLDHDTDSAMYNYHVTDGQQRLNAIWQFRANKYRLGDSTNTRKAKLVGLQFSDLTKEWKNKFLDFTLVTAVISEATSDEVRELFARLQKGSRLTPPELRNSLPSQLGDCIRAMAENHAFFCDDLCPFPSSRFKRHDLCALAFLLEVYRTERDLKAPDLRLMYEEHAGNVPSSAAEKVSRVLHFMSEMQRFSTALHPDEMGLCSTSTWWSRSTWSRVSPVTYSRLATCSLRNVGWLTRATPSNFWLLKEMGTCFRGIKGSTTIS